MKLTIDSDVDRVFNELNETYMKQVPFAASQAINRVAYTIAKERLPSEADRNFHLGATRWTKQGFEYTKSHKNDLSAHVRTRAKNEYLALQIHGGTRRPEAGKGIIQRTRNSRTTKFGNVSKKMRANYLKRKSFDNYFVGTPKGLNPKTQYGVWQRTKKGLKMHMQIVNTPVKYNRKFKFYKYAKSQFYKDFEWQFARALVRAKAPYSRR